MLLRDILSDKDPQVAAVAQVIAHVAPDVLLLTDFDYDAGYVALAAFADQLRQLGLDYPHIFTLRPNTGMATGFDMDGDGRKGRARDGQSYGLFAGQGGMALLSRYPIDLPQVEDFSTLLWQAFPGAMLPEVNGAAFPSPEAQAVQRLSTTGHWVVPINLPDGRQLRLMAYYASPPVFDGPEDRNGKRNHDETRFWQAWLDGKFGQLPKGPLVLLGDANLDPNDGDGLQAAMADLLAEGRLQDVRPTSRGGVAAARSQGGINLSHKGDPALDTVDWPDAEGPGNLRVDYVVPSSDLKVLDAGVFWPVAEEGLDRELMAAVTQASRHRLVWLDLDIP